MCVQCSLNYVLDKNIDSIHFVSIYSTIERYERYALIFLWPHCKLEKQRKRNPKIIFIDVESNPFGYRLEIVENLLTKRILPDFASFVLQ